MDDVTLRNALLEAQDYMLSQLPAPKDCDYEFSRRFRRKMKRLIAKDKSPVWYYFSRAAAIVLLVVGITGGLLLGFNENVRAEVLRWISERFSDNAFQYQSVEDEKIDVSKYTLEGNVPEGYQLVDRFGDENAIDEVYVNESGKILSFSAMSPGYEGDYYIMSDRDWMEEPVYLGSVKAEIYLAKKDGESSLIVWRSKEGILFTIQGVFEEEQLISLAEKINK